MIFRIVMIAVSMVMLSFSIGYGAAIGSIYHVKFQWKTEKNITTYYEMTAYIFNSMSKEPAYLYSEYGDMDGVYIWLPDSDSYAKLKTVISSAKSPYIDPVIDHNPTLKTLLDKMVFDIDRGKIEPTCEIHKKMNFSDDDDAMKYLIKLQYHIFRRGYLVFMMLKGKTQKKFDIMFDFYADCASKKAIVNDLLDVVSHDHTVQRQLY